MNSIYFDSSIHFPLSPSLFCYIFVVDGGAIQLDGKDYVSYVLRESFDSVFRSLEVSFRTEANNGYLFYAKDHDYCILEVSALPTALLIVLNCCFCCCLLYFE